MNPINSFKIEKVSLKDLSQLQEIGKSTFFETYAAGNSEENMSKYLEEGFSLEKLAAELNDPNTQFYFAKTNGKVIGYLKLNFGNSQTKIQNEKALEIERIYVVNAYQGKNAGQTLYNKALEIAHTKKVKYIWLGCGKKTQKR
jgi:diamine N-acetyltransferase